MFLPVLLFSQRKQDAPITLNLEQQSVGECLAEIELLLDIKFAFNSSFVNSDSIISLSVEDQSLKATVSNLFDDRLVVKEVDDYIILVENKRLTKKRNTKNKKSPDPVRFSGYIFDARTALPIDNASIYNFSDSRVTISDSTGYFEFIPKYDNRHLSFNIAKKGYQDTIIMLAHNNQSLRIDLIPEVVEISKHKSQKTTVIFIDSNQPKAFQLLPEAAVITSQNLFRISDNRFAQVSLLPSVGTNWMSKGIIDNHLSLNIIAGYNGSVEVLEVGGLMNFNNGYVKGMQVAGISNVVREKTSGLQIAGLFNINKLKVSGFQISGLFNSVSDSVSGLQVAGLSNKSESNIVGLQIGGAFNIHTGNLHGCQISMLYNHISDDLKGLQISGLVNKTGMNKGLQLGVVNISERSKGVALGLVNYVKNGYNRIEFKANEVLYTNLSYKMGAQHFYNIYSFGIRPSATYLYGLGFGFGSSVDLSKKSFLNFEILTNYIFSGNFVNQKSNLNNRFDISYEYKFKSKIFVSFGPSLSHIITTTDHYLYQISKQSFIGKPFYSKTDSKGETNKIGFGFNFAFGYYF